MSIIAGDSAFGQLPRCQIALYLRCGRANLTTGRTGAKDLKKMTVDREIGVPCQVIDQLVDGAAGEGDDFAAIRTDKVMTVAGGADDIGSVAIAL